MATYYWVAASANTWTSNNWSVSDGGGASGTYPQAADTAIFKSSSSNFNCTVNANINVTKLDMRSDYSGNFDVVTYDVTVEDVDFSGSGTIDYGTGSTWFVSGNFDTHLTSGTHTGAEADFEFTGVGKILWPRTIKTHGGVWVKNGASYQLNNVTFYSGAGGTGNLIIDGTVTGTGILFNFYGQVQLTGSFSAEAITSYNAQNGGGIAVWSGTYNPSSGILNLRDWSSTGILAPIDYSTNNVIIRMYSQSTNSAFKLSAGTYTFYDWRMLADYASKNTNINTTNNPSIIVKGPITFSQTLGTTSYTEGSGTITMDSTGDFVVTTLGFAMENMVIDKDSGITLDSDLNVVSLTISNGDFDANGYNVTVSADALDISTSGTVDCGSGDWTCWGDVIIDGTGTYNEDTADFYLKGTSKNLAVNNGYWAFRNIYVTGSYSANGAGAADNVVVANICDITGTLAVGNIDDGDLLLGVNSDLRIQSGGTLTDRVAGTGYVRFYAPEVGITVLDGTLDHQNLLVYYPHTDASWVPGTYDCRCDFVSSKDLVTTVNLEAGTYNFTGGLIQFRIGITAEVHSYDMTVNLNAATVFQTSLDTPFAFVANVSTSTGDINFNCNNADFNLSGGISQTNSSASSVFDWNKGTGTITFEGSEDVGANVTNWSLEDIVINNSGGSVDFISAVTCETYTVTAGSANFYDDATTGAVSITGGTQIMSGTNKTWTCPSFTVNAGSSAAVDVDDNNVTITGTGDLSFLDNCTIDLGSRTWTCNGDFFAIGTNVVLTRGTSTLRLTGTGNFTCTGTATTKYLYKVEIPTGAVRTILTGSVMRPFGGSGSPGITIDGTLTCSGSVVCYYRASTTLNSTGIINGESSYLHYRPYDGYGFTTFHPSSTFSPGTYSINLPLAGSISEAGVYDCVVDIQGQSDAAWKWEPSAGTYTFNDTVSFRSSVADGSLTIDNSINDPDMVFKGSVTIDETGDVIWTAGIGTVTFGGTGDHTIDFGDELIEDVHIEKDSSGKITLNDNFSADSLTITTGKFDANDYDVTLTGDFVMTAGTGTEVWGGSGIWDVGGSWNSVAVTTDLFHAETSEIKLTGSGTLEAYCDGYINDFHKLTVSGNYTTPNSSASVIIYEGTDGWLKIENGGKLTVADTGHFIWIRGSNDLIIETGGELAINSNARVYIREPDATYGIPTNDGSITGDGQLRLHNWISTSVIDPGTYCTLYCYQSGATNAEVEFESGTYTINGDIQVAGFNTGNTVVDIGTNNSLVSISDDIILDAGGAGTVTLTRAGATNNWNIGGDWTLVNAGPKVYTKGSAGAIITLNGTSDQNVDFSAGDIEDLINNKASGQTILDANMTAESFTLTAGTWESGAFDITTSGDFDVIAGTLNAGSGNWTISGNADFTTAGTFNRETSNFIFDGSSVTVTGGGNDATLYKIHFHTLFDGVLAGTLESRTNVGSSDVLIDGIVDVTGVLAVWDNTDVVLGSTANFSGVGTLRFYDWDGELSIDPSAILSPALMYLDCCMPGMILPARDYAADGIDAYICYCDNILATFEFQTGNTSFDNVSIINEGTYTSSFRVVSGVNFHVTGNLDVEEQSTGQILWRADGNTYLSGTGNITANTNDIYTGKLHILKSSGVTLSSNMNVESLAITTGDFDANDFDVTVANNTNWSTDGIISMGAGTWTLSGNFDYSSFGGTLTEETSLVVMDGTSKTIEGNDVSANMLHDVNIDGTITTAGTGYINQYGDLHTNGTLTLTGQNWQMRDSALATWTGGIYVNEGGEVTGTGTLQMIRPASGGGLLATTGDLTMGALVLSRPESTGILPAYDYSTVTDVVIIGRSGGAGIFNWQNGAYTFNNLALETWDATNLTVDGRTNTPTSITVQGDLALEAASSGDVLIYNNHASQAIDWIIQGDVTLTEPSTGETVWTKGTGGIDFTGTANQSVDLDVNGTLEEFTMDKTGGTLTFTGNWISESFLAVDGELDFNGQTVTTTGDFTINAANGTDATIVSDADAMNAANITVGNDFYISNITFNATATWYLDVQGASALAFDVGVRYSDADWNGGTTIDATKVGNRDLGVNYNWDFGGVANIQSTSFHCFPWTRYTNRFVRGNRRN